jgi:hypothetical protein
MAAASTAQRTFWSGRRTSVTGAAGFIGSHLPEALVPCRCPYRALDRYNSHNDYGRLVVCGPDLIGEVEIVRGTLPPRAPPRVRDHLHRRYAERARSLSRRGRLAPRAHVGERGVRDRNPPPSTIVSQGLTLDRIELGSCRASGEA